MSYVTHSALRLVERPLDKLVVCSEPIFGRDESVQCSERVPVQACERGPCTTSEGVRVTLKGEGR